METTDNGHSEEKRSNKPETDVLVDDFLSSATIHGLHKAAANKSFIRRCVWIIMLIGMLTFLSIFTYLELSIYFRFDTVTNSRVSVRKNVEFPAVTICNVNQVKNSVVDCADLEYLMFRQSELSNYLSLPIRPPNNSSSISGDVIDKCVRAHSHDLEMFRLCFWEGRVVNCSDIFKARITPLGMCFTFNGVLPQKESRMFGSLGGLRVVFDIEQHLYLFPETLQAGIKVILHEPTEIPLTLMRSFLVGPGMSAEAVLFRNKEILLPPPYGNCVEKESDVSRLKRFNKYSKVACWTECFLNAVESHCRCRHYFTSGSARLCNHDELINCHQAITELLLENVTEMLRDVSKNGCQPCPQLCTTYKYDWSLSYAAFGSNRVNERLVNASFFPDQSYIRSNYIDLTLFYNSLSENIIEEVPAKLFNDIIGNVGGQMGMFLGASILSIVELIEFGCLIIAKQRSISPTSTANKNRKKNDFTCDTPAKNTITLDNFEHT